MPNTEKTKEEILKSNRRRDEILEILESKEKGTNSLYQLLHYAESEIKEEVAKALSDRWIDPNKLLPEIDQNADKYYKNQSKLVVVWINDSFAFARYHHGISEWIVQGFNGSIPPVIKWTEISPPKD